MLVDERPVVVELLECVGHAVQPLACGIRSGYLATTAQQDENQTIHDVMYRHTPHNGMYKTVRDRSFDVLLAPALLALSNNAHIGQHTPVNSKFIVVDQVGFEITI